VLTITCLLERPFAGHIQIPTAPVAAHGGTGQAPGQVPGGAAGQHVTADKTIEVLHVPASAALRGEGSCTGRSRMLPAAARGQARTELASVDAAVQLSVTNPVPLRGAPRPGGGSGLTGMPKISGLAATARLHDLSGRLERRPGPAGGEVRNYVRGAKPC